MFTDAIAQAIATMEGYFKPGTVAARNNNPGNLRTWGSRPVVDGFAHFDTPEEGWAALRRQVEINASRGLTLQEFFGGKAGVYSGYAPAADNNRPLEYARFVAQRVGIPDNMPLNAASGGSPVSGDSPMSPPENNLGVYVAVTVAAAALLFIATD